MVDRISLALAERCEGIVAIGSSVAVEEEVRRVQAHGGRVYRSVDELPFAFPSTTTQPPLPRSQQAERGRAVRRAVVFDLGKSTV